MIFGKKAKPQPATCDVCRDWWHDVQELDGGFLCKRCIEKAIYWAAFEWSKRTPPREIIPLPPAPARPLDPARRA